MQSDGQTPLVWVVEFYAPWCNSLADAIQLFCCERQNLGAAKSFCAVIIMGTFSAECFE